MLRGKALLLSIVVIVAALIVSTSVLLYQVFLAPSSNKVTYTPSLEIPGEKKLVDFTLIDQYGRPFTLSSVKGKVILIYFGYTNCPDVCPIVMAKYKYVLEQLGEDADKVALILVTTDPERDTPEVLREYVAKFDERIIALTGKPEELKKVWIAYGVYAEAEQNQDEKDYYVAHTALVLAADKNMIVRFALTPELPKEEYLQGVRWLLSL